MSIADIIILLPLLWGAYKGYNKGLVMELISMLAMILGIVISFRLMQYGIDFLRPMIGADNKMIPLLSFIGIFLVVVLGVNYLGKWLKKVLDYSFMGKLDDIGGAILGMLKWAFAFSLILWLLNEAKISIPHQYVADSLLYPYICEYSPAILNWSGKILPFTGQLVETIKSSFNPGS